MNKTIVFVTFSILIALGLIGTILLLLVAPQHFGTFTGFLVVLLGLATSAAGTFWSLGKAREVLGDLKHDTSTKLDIVQSQTNGTLSRMTNQIIALNEEVRKKDRHIADLEAAILHNPKKGIK